MAHTLPLLDEDESPSDSVVRRPLRIDNERVLERWETSVSTFRRAVESYHTVLSIRSQVRRVSRVVDAAAVPTIVNALKRKSAPPHASGALTRREAEVARLIMQGFTNRQIAAVLVITHGTAANHVAHVLDKLNVANRTQVAVMVQRRESMFEGRTRVPR